MKNCRTNWQDGETGRSFEVPAKEAGHLVVGNDSGLTATSPR